MSKNWKAEYRRKEAKEATSPPPLPFVERKPCYNWARSGTSTQVRARKPFEP